MHPFLLTGKKENTMTVTTPAGAQAAILNCQGQKPKILRRILKTTALYACTFDKDKRMLPLVEHQLYAKPFQAVISFNPHRTPVKQGFF